MQGKIGNGAIAAGTSTKDAEFKYIGENNTPLADFSIAVNSHGEAGVFVNCKAFGKLADYAALIRKGDAVCVVGIVESREYNEKIYKTLNAQWLNIAKAQPAQPAKPAAPMFEPSAFEDLPDDGELPF